MLYKFKQLLFKWLIDQISVGNQSFTFNEKFKIQGVLGPLSWDGVRVKFSDGELGKKETKQTSVWCLMTISIDFY